MLVRPHLPGYRWFHVFRNAAIRTGVYVGVCLTLVFTAWLVIANHAPFLDRFAMDAISPPPRSCAFSPRFPFSVSALARASHGLRPSWLADFQRELSRALLHIPWSQQQAQHVPCFYVGSGRVHDTHHALLDCRRDLESP